MAKIYKSKKMVITLNKGKKCYRFEPSNPAGSVYMATTAEEVEAIEGSKLFKEGKIYCSYADAEEEQDVQDVQDVQEAGAEIPVVSETAAEAAAEPSGEVEGQQVVEEVLNCADARMWLKNHGVTTPLNTKAAILAAAVAAGVEFPNLG